MNRRWYFVVMVAVAIAISYFDRQTLPVAIAAIQRNIPLSNQQFSYLQTAFLLAYAAMYVLGGRLLDAFGTRKGFLFIMLWWSLACALHGLASGFMLLLIARFLLGGGEGGAFPAATRVVAEWIEPGERSTAMGFINAGTAIGSVLAPPLIGFVLLRSGWRAVFLVAGIFGLAWVLWWAVSYRSNAMTLSSNTVDARVIGSNLGWQRVVSMRRVQTFVFAKFMSDSAWYFLLFWLPKYLYDVRGFDIKQVSYYAWIPYAASGIGSFIGGWLSSRLIQNGRSIDFSQLAEPVEVVREQVNDPLVPQLRIGVRRSERQDRHTGHSARPDRRRAPTAQARDRRQTDRDNDEHDNQDSSCGNQGQA